MQLQTNIPLQPQQHNQIDYDSKIVLLGSCFTENIGEKLAYFKFQNAVNPFGIFFNPIAIENLILNAINEKVYTEEGVFFHNERWHSFEAHSELSSPDKKVLLQRLNEFINLTNQQIHESTHIIITLGTSWVYRFIETDTIVTNCHKIPQKKFLKRILSVDDITNCLLSIVALIKSINKKASIIFTVSPVRHLRDGFVENQQSKAHLISAVHEIVDNKKSTFYFPAYEIMMDELRDYRFYAEDMLHPNKIAIDYIWEKFSGIWISDKAKKTMEEVDSFQKSLSHKPFNPTGKQHEEFLVDLENKIKGLEKAYPSIKF